MTLTELELDFLEGFYEAVNEEGIPTAVVFNTYPSLTSDTDAGTVTLGTSVPVPLNVSPPAPDTIEFDSDGDSGRTETREVSRISLPAWDGSEIIDLVPTLTVVSHMTVTWAGKLRQILKISPKQSGETVVGWTIFTEL